MGFLPVSWGRRGGGVGGGGKIRQGGVFFGGAPPSAGGIVRRCGQSPQGRSFCSGDACVAVDAERRSSRQRLRSTTGVRSTFFAAARQPRRRRVATTCVSRRLGAVALALYSVSTSRR